MKRFSTIFLLLISCNIAHADDNEGIIAKPVQYDVEVIVFEDAQARYINSEDWPREAVSDTHAEEKSELPENLDTLSIDEINAIDNKTSTASFANIKPGILNREYKRINASSNYNVLFYGSWRQPGLDAKKAFEIDIEQLKNIHPTNSKSSISGNFKLVLARYLHIYSTLDYQRKAEHKEPGTENTEASIPPTETTVLDYESYPIKNHRRMRSKELHYLDHPLVGMLIQINPAKVSAEETAEKPAAPKKP